MAAVQEDVVTLPDRPPLPLYWLGFDEMKLPPVPDNSSTRQAALRAIDVDYVGPMLPCLRSPGGTLTDLDRSTDGVHLLFNNAKVVRLPPAAVLHPAVQIGRWLPPGTLLGDFLPRRRYQHWSAVAQLLGAEDSAWLLQQAVAACDQPHMGLVCRRAEFVAGTLTDVGAIFEDVRPLLGAASSASASPPVAWTVSRSSSFQFSRPRLQVDLKSLHSHWDSRFQLDRPCSPVPRKNLG